MATVPHPTPQVSNAPADSPPVLHQIAELALDTADTQMPDDVASAARRCLIDWLGVAIAGTYEPATAKVRAAFDIAVPNRGGTRLVPRSATTEQAALMLGVAGHALDYDDTEYVNLIHVSSTLFPALLALGATEPLSGSRLLAIFNAAYEAEYRVGTELGRKLTARSWHVSGVVGHIGAPLAAGMALRLPVEKLAHAMAICGTAASGFVAAFGTMSKPLQLARSGANGVIAARLAREGFTGPVRLLESSPGFTLPLLGEVITDWSSVSRTWGRPYAVSRNAFKPHAACMITHPTIDAAIAIGRALRADGVAPDAIDAIACGVNPLVPKVAGNMHPVTGLEGKFSVAYCCALGLTEARATPECFTPDFIARADLQQMLARTEIRVDASIGEQQSHVSVRTRDGRRYEQAIEMAKGNPDNALTDAELGAKFMHLVEPALGARAAAILEDLRRFDSIGDVAGWLQGL